MDRIKLYCDGAASNNGKENAIGGWAFVIIKNDEIVYSESGKEIGATNQMMELQAMISGYHYLKSNYNNDILVDVYSDSAYIIQCYIQKWWINWSFNGWKNSKKEPVANKELWKMLIPCFGELNYTFNKVKGHSTDDSINSYWNNYVDKLAVEARLS